MPISQLKLAVQKKDLKKIRFLYGKTNIVDFTNLFEQLTVEEQLIVLRCLDTIASTEIINRLDSKHMRDLIEAFTKPEMKELVSKLYADDIVDLIEDLPYYLVKKVISFATPAQRKDINFILRYAEDTIGSEMDVNFIALNINWYVADALNRINKFTGKVDDRSLYYVTDERGLLIGYVRASDLLAVKNETKTRIASITETNVVSLRTSMLTEKAVEKMRYYELFEVPVVDSQNNLVGVLNSDDILELLKEAQIDDINKAAGVIEEPDTEYFATSAWKMFWSRFPWLAATILITTFTQIVLTFLLQENAVQNKNLMIIIPFIPFILTIVGNIALQSTAIIIKNIILKVIDRPQYAQTLRKELNVAVLILIATLILNLPRSAFVQLITEGESKFDANYWISFGIVNFVIALSIFLVVLFSASLPILAHWYGIDPSLMSSPLLTTVVDFIVTTIAVGVSFAFSNYLL